MIFPMSTSNARGFALMGLLSVVRLARVILVVGAPNLDDLRRKNRLTIAVIKVRAAARVASQASTRFVRASMVVPNDANGQCGTATATSAPRH